MAGALGALTSYLENLKRKARRNISDIRENPRDWERMAAARWREDLPKQFESPESGLDFVGGPLGALAGVIKRKGGNWLEQSLKDFMDPLKRSETPRYTRINDEGFSVGEGYGRPMTEAELAQMSSDPVFSRNAAVNRWVEGPLTKYMKTQMATPEDPVRALAEQGILHYTPDYEFASQTGMYNREAAGFPRHGVAKSDLARGWEADADMMIEPVPVERFRDPIMKAYDYREPWMDKLPEGTPVYNAVERENLLGFDHLVDELQNALNPESGLPRNLQLRPEQLQQMGMEKAVRHVDAINKWRKAQEVAANAELANRGMTVREYAKNNPMGLRWMELGPDEELAQMYKQGIPAGEENALRYKEKLKALEDQLKYEGDIMGHCVGGYCDDVLGGHSRIFSLRDAKGEPHVTVEVAPGRQWYERPGAIDENKLVKEEWPIFWKENAEGPFGKKSMYDAFKQRMFQKYPEDLSVSKFFSESPLNIVQIKGKANLAPKEEYLPFVQDFVRNSPIGGRWGEVGDIDNARLYRPHGMEDYLTKDQLYEIHKDIGNPNWQTIDNILQDEIDRGYKDGGAVRGRPDWWDLIDTPEE